jgi:branched-chain amino acid transport system permease protein
MAIFAMSWDILSGYTGYVSFGHPFLIGTVGYTTAMLTYHLGMPLYASIPLAVLVGLAAGMLFFLPGLRLRGNYFCLVTLALMVILHHLVIAIRPDLTGGTRGLPGLPSVVMGSIPNFYLSFGIMFLIAVGLWYVAKSDIGTVLNAIRLDEDAVSAAGLSTLRFKLIAFTLSAFTAGIGGAFYIHYAAAIAPESVFSVSFLLTIVIAALIGGQNSIIGPMIGAYFLTFLLEYLRPYIAGPPRFLLYSAIALGLYVYKVRGFYGIIQDIANWHRERRRKAEEHVQVT